MAFDRFIAFPEGFEFTLLVWSPNEPGRTLPPFPHWYWDRSSPEIPPDVIRLGVTYPDGRRATNLNWLADVQGLNREGPVLYPLDEAGWQPHWEQEYWVGPSPPPGPVSLVVEWPAHHIAETSVELDGAAIHVAAAEADVVWS